MVWQVTPQVFNLSILRYPGRKVGFWRKVRFYLTVLTHILGYIACRQAMMDPRAKEFLAKIKAEHGYKNISIVGYCFGGPLSIRIAQFDAITSIVVPHPGRSTLKAIKATDTLSHGFVRKGLRFQAKAHFRSRAPELQYGFVDYPGIVHGFASRPAREQPLSVEGQQKVLGQTVKWFQSTL
ncbi:hypothetical protein BDM02DRAFT_3267777 [Thelephora ganbajun]|uniref:Uncharacterized protein n=1 Tax=Thelephora ganbajun TaxID=370292 RepID=A0ACB6ZMF2_THEGA|nr:hypothetical protein BDM02DRAFT_3267777 [Thelephora ganbajun]